MASSNKLYQKVGKDGEKGVEMEGCVMECLWNGIVKTW